MRNNFVKIHKKYNFVKIIVSVFMICAMLLPVMNLSRDSLYAEAATTIAEDKKAISALNNELKSIAASRKRLEDEIKELKKSQQSQLAQKENLDKQIALYEKEIEQSNELIRLYKEEAEKKDIQISEQTAEYEKNYQLFLDMVRYTCEEGSSISYLEIIIGSKSFDDFLTRLDFIGEMLGYQKKIMDRLTQSKEDLEKLKAELDNVIEQQSVTVASLEAKATDLEKKREEVKKLISDLQADQAKAEKALKEANEEEESVQGDIRRIQSELAAKENALKYVGGEMLWPAEPKYTYVSSGFGMRDDPFTGLRTQHNGIDIPASYGSNVYAANDGEVIIAKNSSSYGNYVVISHGGGMTTLYAHNSKLVVKEGQQVKKGDVIAKVGSTGRSTGNHIHFEVSKDGVRQDPMKYLKP